jgi:RHS repeat-associated protein
MRSKPTLAHSSSAICTALSAAPFRSTSEVIESTSGTLNSPATTWSDNWLGQITKETVPDGTSLNWTYSSCSSGTTTCYNGAYEEVQETAEDASGNPISTSSTDLDSFGRVVATTAPLEDGTNSLVEQKYDDFGNVVKRSAPCPASDGTCTDWTQTTYDALNRPIQIVSPTPWIAAGSATTTIDYEGLATKVVNGDTEQSTRVTDATGAVRETRDAMGYGQNFTRDSDGNVVQVTDAQGNTLITQGYYYGGDGDYLASRTDRALGSWSYSPDALGEVTSYTDAKGQVFELYYDDLSRMKERDDGVSASGTETMTKWTWGVSPAAHDVGQLDVAETTTANGTYAENDSYDGDGRLGGRTITIPGDTAYQYGYSYNSQGLLARLQYPVAGSHAGLALNYGYQHGILARVTDAATGTVYWQANAVNTLGEATKVTLGNSIVAQTQYTPDSGWPTEITSGLSGSATAQNQSFAYDALGNLTQRQDNNAGLTESAYYDPDNRLSYSTLQAGSGTAANSLQMGYNADGGIYQKTETGGTDTPVAYSVGWTSYNYPKSISGTLASGANESSTFDYGPDRARWRMVYTEGSATETTEYIGGLMEKVSSNIGTDYRYYIRGGDGLAAIQAVDGSGTATTDYVLSDPQGSLSSLLSSTGSNIVSESFTAFGARREASTWSGPPTSAEVATMESITRQGFTGQTALGRLGMNHMNGRVEDAISGTFLSPDPTITSPYDTQDYNRYAYVADNPLSIEDPSGFSWLSNLLNPFSKNNPLNPFSKKNPLNPLSNYNPLNPFGTVGSWVTWRQFVWGRDTGDHVLLKNRWMQPIAEFAACYWGGPWGCASANAYLTRLDGGSMDQALVAFGTSYFSYRANLYIDQYSGELGAAGTAGARGLVAGAASSANGGSFTREFEMAAGFSLADSAYQDYADHPPGWAPGQNRPYGSGQPSTYTPNPDGSVPESFGNGNTFGTNSSLTAISGGTFGSRVAR